MLLKQVVLIGAGNVAWRLGLRLHEQGIKIALVFSRRIANAQALAGELNCPATDSLDKIPALDNCLYLLAISDDHIATVAAGLGHLNGPGRVLAHTSGAVSSRVIAGDFDQTGVFYPLQTLSRDRPVNFEQLPVCVYSADPKVQDGLLQLASRITQQARVIDDEQRKKLHVAAVFVNNFSNHLFSVGQQIVEAEGLSFDLLRPLIAETAAKVMEQDPKDMQTGPARRGDQQTILAHLQYLQKFPELQNLYRVISHSLQQMYHLKP
ncbi:Rossmann-like and DUF2520 domain-containing protein [Flavilitoribacter nigricans]|uniref:Oxidoreductase n=1 Tax=Flavilitoribacter nigricans (strain ATCC 23147 / DSM 23189 / NBRC 102662 / NCIMB 1420 / SS-2) TaxID=1122177 RepID=A0A2D0ND19_FLAN2|nr:Rossmann-like and DUF2520 domain-containing protein [Flavilitoribacter nigricans]PHN06377.1 oxidoreductase [Flavilitoribacter nigricans DSM 23189 = NBRC 102662]